VQGWDEPFTKGNPGMATLPTCPDKKTTKGTSGNGDGSQKRRHHLRTKQTPSRRHRLISSRIRAIKDYLMPDDDKNIIKKGGKQPPTPPKPAQSQPGSGTPDRPGQSGGSGGSGGSGSGS
jgi:hypothetical protein